LLFRVVDELLQLPYLVQKGKKKLIIFFFSPALCWLLLLVVGVVGCFFYHAQQLHWAIIHGLGLGSGTFCVLFSLQAIVVVATVVPSARSVA